VIDGRPAVGTRISESRTMVEPAPPGSRDSSPAGMAVHVDLVGALFVIWGGLTTVVGLSTLSLGIGGAALIASASGRGAGGQIAAGLTAAAFTTLAIIAIIWGIAHIAVGVPLRRRTHQARLAALMLGSIDLLLLPYGTALGIYALWVLLNDEGRKVFNLH
jgi:hypothetical protein